MSFLRCERILNPHLTHNNVSQSPLFDIFRAALAKASHHVVRGKLLSAPSNADTVIMDNYRHDIYVDEGIIMGRLEKMLVGLTELMTLEVVESIEVLGDIYGKGRLFKCDRMENMYRALSLGKEGGYQVWSRKVKQWIQA
jgi:fructose-1,6-bisphosphatase